MCTALRTHNNEQQRKIYDTELDPYLESVRNEPCILSIPRHNVSTSGCTEATTAI